MNVVLAFNDPCNQRIFKKFIKKVAEEEVFTVTLYVANNGKEAAENITLLERYEIFMDLVFTEFLMPEMNGITLAKTIKDKNIPVYMISADKHNEDEHKQSVDGILNYPVSMNHIRKVMMKLREDMMKSRGEILGC